MDSLESLLGISDIQKDAEELWIWIRDGVFTFNSLGQISAILVALGLAFWLRKFLFRKASRFSLPKSNAFFRIIKRNATSLISLALMWLILAVFSKLGLEHKILTITASLVTAWIFINMISFFVRDPVWARFISVTAWTVAALNITGFLPETVDFLDKLGFELGNTRVSALGVVKGFFAFAFLFWVASNLSKLLEKRVAKLPNLAPSTQVLFAKLLRIALIGIAFMVTLNTIGIDLTAFAVFTGALGVGLGFGLQKIVSNFVSGIILLVEKSIKPGDVIAVNNTYGWVKSLGARYASVITRDGIEHIIPNEDFITQKVENWSFSNRYIRLHLPVGISYGSDLDLAIKLCLEAASEENRVQNNFQQSVCLITGFGENSVNLELRFWINDPQNGCTNIKSHIYKRIWDKFRASGSISFPFPQRDLHIKSSPVLKFQQVTGD